MARSTREVEQQIDDGLADYADQKKAHELKGVLENSPNNIPFTWLDNPTSPDEEGVLETAFQFSGFPEDQTYLLTLKNSTYFQITTLLTFLRE